MVAGSNFGSDMHVLMNASSISLKLEEVTIVADKILPSSEMVTNALKHVLMQYRDKGSIKAVSRCFLSAESPPGNVANGISFLLAESLT